jgi:hypothetical protein
VFFLRRWKFLTTQYSSWKIYEATGKILSIAIFSPQQHKSREKGKIIIKKILPSYDILPKPCREIYVTLGNSTNGKTFYSNVMKYSSRSRLHT